MSISSLNFKMVSESIIITLVDSCCNNSIVLVGVWWKSHID